MTKRLCAKHNVIDVDRHIIGPITTVIQEPNLRSTFPPMPDYLAAKRGVKLAYARLTISIILSDEEWLRTPSDPCHLAADVIHELGDSFQAV